MKIIYIAGAYRSDKGEWHIQQNIRNAEEAALCVWEAGGVALCPHKNTAFFGGARGIPDKVWLEGDLTLLEKCDAVWAIRGWEKSTGAIAEVRYAALQNIPVFLTYEEVVRFIDREE